MTRLSVGSSERITHPRAAALPEPIMFLQPIVELATGRSVAAEALARFPREVQFPVRAVFAAAEALGRRAELEARCIRGARVAHVGMPSEVAIAVNVSADSLLQPVVQAALAGDLRNVIVEITEEATTQPSSAVLSALAGLRSAGAVIAVDDVSTGHAGLVRLSRIRPDIIKLDRSLTAGATRGDEHVAVIETLVDLARRLGSAVLAEGVESTRDLPALTQLGIDYVQGWATGPPTPTWQPVPPDVIDACLQARQSLLRVSAGREQVDVFHRAILALVTCSRRSQFQTALAQATEALSATNIGVSLLNGHNSLHEVAATGNAPDPAEYSLTDYPATAAALREARILEVYIDEPDADPAEVSALRKNDVTSLLLIPLYVERVPLGVLEISRRQARRYSTADIASARRLADHVAQALARLS